MRWLGILLGLFAALAANEAAAQESSVLSVGVTGRVSAEGLESPTVVLGISSVSKMIVKLAQAPLSAEAVSGMIADTDVDLAHLLSLNILREDSGLYYIDFNYTSARDHKIFEDVGYRYARSLAEEYKNEWRSFAGLFDTYPVKTVPREMIAYAIIGAYSLDWDGLNIAAENEYMASTPETPRGRYILWAKEKSDEVSLARLYWGSHNSQFGGLTLTSFGDHAAIPRFGFPDFAWRMNAYLRRLGQAPLFIGVDEPLRETASNSLATYGDLMMADVTRILKALRRGAGTTADIVKASEVPLERVAPLLYCLNKCAISAARTKLCG